MKNAMLPSVSSQLYSNGNNVEVTDLPLQMDSKIDVYGSNFFDSRSYVCQDHQLDDEGIAVHSQSPLNYEPGQNSLIFVSITNTHTVANISNFRAVRIDNCEKTGLPLWPSASMTVKRLDCPCVGEEYLTTMSSYGDNYIPQQPLLFSERFSVQRCDEFQPIQNSRKRPIEINEIKSKTSSNNLISSKSTLNESTSKKKRALLFEAQWDHTVKEETKNNQRVPARKSQKLSDRITVLQKLVSPYGKTDTAAVLQEASISIKALQDQIQSLFDLLSTSYISTKTLHSQKIGEKRLDLRSRGFCLVPVSLLRSNSYEF
ncbi:unnamed protein product [Ilex paraguariensis]|uniref:BHLH domain-containing protein n=1 Tax=Ilex paraguariensis TaxID=185542 RepID=A0ABC8UKC6_9AQUA